jgi:transposase-like protein
MRQVWTKRSIRQAIREVKEFEWEGDYRPSARAALKEILEKRMVTFLDEYLMEVEELGIEDRRNGSYKRHILTEMGDVVLAVVRTRTMSANEVVKAFARRSPAVDRLILGCFTLGLSTRKVGEALLPLLGERVSASTVSRVAKQLDAAVVAYHRRPLESRYRFLIFDGVVLKKKTGSGSAKRLVLVALGITHEGKKEVIDFRLAPGESQEAWESFFSDLYKRGLTGEGVELIVLDGGKGLLSACGLVYSSIPIQRCWAHKDRNVLSYIRKADHDAVKKDLHKISHAKGRKEAEKMFRTFVFRWSREYPKAVECLRKDIDDLLTFFEVPDPNVWNQIRTTNAIERRFEEVRRRTRPMGVFSDRTSMERILYAVFTYENWKEGTRTPLLLTQNY